MKTTPSQARQHGKKTKQAPIKPVLKIPGMLPDGRIPLDLLGKDLAIEVPSFTGIQVGTLTLYINTIPSGQRVNITATDAANPDYKAQFSLSKSSYPAEGKSAEVRLLCGFTYGEDGVAPSDEVKIILDREAPGGSSLRALPFTLTTITKNDLVEGQLQVDAYAWYGMKPGDVITPWVSDAEPVEGTYGQYLLKDSEVIVLEGGKSVLVRFPPSKFEKYTTAYFGYALRDALGNKSVLSATTALAVDLDFESIPRSIPRDQEEPLDLQPPVVPVADPATSIIKIVELENDISVTVPTIPPKEDGTGGMKVTDSIQLVWEDKLIGTALDLSPLFPLPPTVELLFPKADFPAVGTDMPGVLEYFLFDTFSESGQVSTGTPLRFDQLAPGGARLPELVFTAEQLAGITLADLENDLLTLKIEPYYDAEAGDQIEVWLGTSETVGEYQTPAFPVTKPADEQTITFTKDALAAGGDGKKFFGYKVTDFAGNISVLSIVKGVGVYLNLPVLAAPLVPEFTDTDLITYNDAVPDVTVNILPYTGVVKGDRIYVEWGDQTVGPFTIEDIALDPLLTVLVPYQKVKDNTLFEANGDVVVRYWLNRADPQRIDSLPTPVKVDLTTPGGLNPDPDPDEPGHQNIKPPRIVSAGGTPNEIPPADYEKPATATIFRTGVDLQPIWKVNDVIQLYWADVSTPGTDPATDPGIEPVTVISGNEGANIDITVPTAVIQKVGVGNIDVKFTITRALNQNNSVTVESPIQKVNVVSAQALPGGSDPLVAGTFPEANKNNVITRPAAYQGTMFRIPLAGLENIDPATDSPKLSYFFQGIASDIGPTPIGDPIPGTQKSATDLPITADMITQGYFELTLLWPDLYKICRNGATLNYSLANNAGSKAAPQGFVVMAMNEAGGGCDISRPPTKPPTAVV